MPYTARVLKVMIASPSDVRHERQAVHALMHEWNAIHSQSRGQVLLPLAWENNSAPAFASRPQEVINRQLTSESDLIVAIFWTRLGTPTGVAPSGTVEEIDEHLRLGKPAMLYFSNEPVRPDSIDEEQYKAVRDFKADVMRRGLVEHYDTLDEFKEKFSRQLAQTIIERFPSTAQSTSVGSLQGMSRDDRDALRGISQDARVLLVAASGDRNAAVLMTEAMGGLSVETNERDFVERGNRRSEAQWRKAVRELVEAGFVEQRGIEGEIFEVTEEGFRAADLVNPVPNNEKKQQLLSLLHQTRLITHELPRDQSKAEQIRQVTLWPDADAALLRELAVPFGEDAANLGAEAHRHLTTVATTSRSVQQTPRERGFDWARFDWNRWIEELNATERTLVSLASTVDPN